MAIALTLREYLDDRCVAYDVLTHRRTSTSARTAAASHIPIDQLAKAVLLKGDAGYLLAVVPASCRVQLDEVASLLDRTYGLASESEAEKLFGDCETGALPPIGTAYGITTVIDDGLGQPEDIYLEAGDHRSLVHLTRRQFEELTWDAYYGHISERTDAARA